MRGSYGQAVLENKHAVDRGRLRFHVSGLLAQTIAGNATGQPPAKSVEYASAATADGAEKDSAATSPAAVPPAEPAVTTEVAPTASIPATELRPAIVKELEAMKQRIAELEKELAASGVTAADAATALKGAEENLEPHPAPAPILHTAVMPQEAAPAPAPAPPGGKITPFSDADWTWLNGNPRNKDTAFDSKFFTPEIRADITYNYDFNKPTDNSEGGSSEVFRANEIQLEQLGNRRRLPSRQCARPVYDPVRWLLHRDYTQ